MENKSIIKMYTLTFSPQSLEDLARLKKSEPAAFKKAGKLLLELQEHRLVYEMENDVVNVAVLRAYP